MSRPIAAAPRVGWREMVAADLGAVERVAGVVHPDYPEDRAVFAERLLLYPAGCLVLDRDWAVEGYAIAHPWGFGAPPGLNTLLGRLPDGADTLHLHDLALMPGARSGGLGGCAMEMLAGQAVTAGLRRMSLVAVSGSVGFWRRQGFEVVAGVAVGSYAGAVFMGRDLG